MSAAPEIYAVASNRELLIEALDARRMELGMSMIEFDDVIGMAPGSSAKYLGPSQVKNIGVDSLLKMTRGLGLRIVLEVDHKQTKRVIERRRETNKKQARPKNYSQEPSKRIYRRVRAAMGKRGAAVTNGNSTPQERSARARYAVMKRWHPDIVLDWNEIKQAVADQMRQATSDDPQCEQVKRGRAPAGTRALPR